MSTDLMTPLIHGRVTDTEGRPIAQARVFLRYSHDSEPARLGTGPRNNADR
jgi:hypothetical protein